MPDEKITNQLTPQNNTLPTNYELKQQVSNHRKLSGGSSIKIRTQRIEPMKVFNKEEYQPLKINTFSECLSKFKLKKMEINKIKEKQNNHKRIKTKMRKVKSCNRFRNIKTQQPVCDLNQLYKQITLTELAKKLTIDMSQRLGSKKCKKFSNSKNFEDSSLIYNFRKRSKLKSLAKTLKCFTIGNKEELQNTQQLNVHNKIQINGLKVPEKQTMTTFKRHNHHHTPLTVLFNNEKIHKSITDFCL